MRLQGYRRLFTADFSEDNQNLVNQLSSSINPAFDNIQAVLNKNVSFSDNIAGTVKDIDLIVGSNGIPNSSTSFKLDTNSSVTMLLVGNQTNLTNPNNYPTSGVTVSWSQTQNGITINHVTGITPNETWRLRVVALI